MGRVVGRGRIRVLGQGQGVAQIGRQILESGTRVVAMGNGVGSNNQRARAFGVVGIFYGGFTGECATALGSCGAGVLATIIFFNSFVQCSFWDAICYYFIRWCNLVFIRFLPRGDLARGVSDFCVGCMGMVLWPCCAVGPGLYGIVSARSVITLGIWRADGRRCLWV